MAREYKQVCELGEIITGKTPSTANVSLWNGNIPFITPTDIKGYDVFYQDVTERTVSSYGALKQKKTILPPNAVCVSSIATIGKMCLTSCVSITNQQINSIVVNKANDYRYVLYLLRYNLPYLQLVGGGSGSGTPIISKNKLAKFKFLVEEDLPKQQKIASILSTYDTLIENNNRRIRLLEQMAENLYKEWFVRFRFPGHEKVEMENGLPKGWEFKKISNICETIGGGTPSTTNSAYWGGNIKWVTPSDITSKNSLALLKIEGRITEEGLRKSAAKLLPPYTILMTSRASIGFFGLCPDSVCTNQGFISIVPNKANTRMYLLYTLKERKDEIIANANGSTFLEISKGRFRKMKVLIPPEVILDMYEKRSHIIFNEVLNLEKQTTLLTRQRDLLLPRLMSGKLEVKP